MRGDTHLLSKWPGWRDLPCFGLEGIVYTRVDSDHWDAVDTFTGATWKRLRLQDGQYQAQETRLDGQDQPNGRTSGMRVVDLQVKVAEEFLENHQRHYKAPVEPICAIGVADGEGLHGAAILGRKEAGVAELAHIYVDGSFQGYSLLYGACWRALKALGYDRAVL